MKPSIFFGFLIGFLISAIYAGILEGTMSPPNSLMYFLVALGVVATLYRTKKAQNGVFYINDAMKSGLQTALISGLILSGFIFLYFYILNPDWVTEHIPKWEAQIKSTEKDLTDVALQEKVEQIKGMYQPLKQSAYHISFILFAGGFFSLVVGMLLKSDKKVSA